MLERFTTQKNIKNGDIEISEKTINGVFSPHWHEFYEIEFVMDGSGEYIIDEKSSEIKKGMLFFMTPVNFHEVHAKNARIINIMFPDRVCSAETLFSVSQKAENALCFKGAEYDFLLSVLRELSDASKNNDTSYSHALLEILLLKIAKKSNIKKNAELSYVQTAMLYLINNFRNNPSLSDAASAAGISAAYLSMLFPAETGMTFKQYLDSLRYEYAKNLLSFSNMTVSEICYESGFSDYANFIRAFKKRYGLPPAKMRKKQN